ncbi:MAG: iron-containing alcohol dehydrogenase [Promethearchaeota archaeon]|nr:MAG: iron-containing alcohol dehydrogenase [Candidatus Lokiarchaeota archaeon]
MWYFYSPSIIYGEDALDFFFNIHGEKCFIVTDKVVKELGLLKILTDKLEEHGKNYEVFDEVVPDPRENGVIKSKQLCFTYQPDIIIALGGGSVIDTAKATWALYELPQYTIDELALNPELFKINTGKKAKFVAIPTTSGTGADVSLGIVISRFEEDQNVWRKMEIPHSGLIPTFTIVDPVFPTKMPPELTASTGFDALAHSLENIISVWRNDISDGLTLKAVEMIFKYLPIAYKDGNNKEARDKMHLAATLAGLAFSNSMAHIGHSLGHSWGSIFHVPHGQCVGIFLPFVLQYCMNDPNQGEKSVEILAKLAKQLGWAKWDDDLKKAANSVIDKVTELQEQINFPKTLKGFGIPRSDLENNLDILVSLCFQSPVCTASPRSPNTEEWKKLFIYSFEGKNIDF